MKNGHLYTTNNGYDRDTKPLIPFMEFLQDLAQVGSYEEFINLTNQWTREELDRLPNKFRRHALTDIKLFREHYHEWKDWRKYSFNPDDINRNSNVQIVLCKLEP